VASPNPGCLLHKPCTRSVSGRNPSVSSEENCSSRGKESERDYAGMQSIAIEARNARGEGTLINLVETGDGGKKTRLVSHLV